MKKNELKKREIRKDVFVLVKDEVCDGEACHAVILVTTSEEEAKKEYERFVQVAVDAYKVHMQDWVMSETENEWSLCEEGRYESNHIKIVIEKTFLIDFE